MLAPVGQPSGGRENAPPARAPAPAPAWPRWSYDWDAPQLAGRQARRPQGCIAARDTTSLR